MFSKAQQDPEFQMPTEPTIMHLKGKRMRPSLCALALITVMIAPEDALQGAPPKHTAKSLDGRWQCVSIEDYPIWDGYVENFRIRFAGNKVQMIVNGEEAGTLVMKTDFSKKPAEIDWWAEDGPAAAIGKWLGVFVLKDDELTLRFRNTGLEPRPDGMNDKHFSILMKFKRINRWRQESKGSP